MATVFLTACGSMSDSYYNSGSDREFLLNSGGAGNPGGPPPMADAPMADGDYSFAMALPGEVDDISSKKQDPASPASDGLVEKIIYSARAEIETRNFDKTIETLDDMIRLHGAIVESSNISGINYATNSYSGQRLRHAHYTIRVPVNNFDTIRAKLDNLGNVVNQNSYAENITSQFIDTEARRNSLLLQEERLLDMMSKADEVADLIMLEQRISDVRYQIEWLTTTLNNWQRQVDYSSLTINIIEVEEYTEFVPVHRSYWEQMGDGIMSTLRGIGNFFTSIFMWLVVSAPVLLFLALAALLVLIIVRSKIRSYKKKRAELYAGAIAQPEPVLDPEQTENHE